MGDMTWFLSAKCDPNISKLVAGYDGLKFAVEKKFSCFNEVVEILVDHAWGSKSLACHAQLNPILAKKLIKPL